MDQPYREPAETPRPIPEEPRVRWVLKSVVSGLYHRETKDGIGVGKLVKMQRDATFYDLRDHAEARLQEFLDRDSCGVDYKIVRVVKSPPSAFPTE